MVLLTILVLVVHDVPLLFHLREVERNRLVTALERDAFTIAGRSGDVLEKLANNGTAEASQITQLIRSYFIDTGGRVVITGGGGFVIATSDEESIIGRDYSTRPEIASALDGLTSTGVRASATLRQDLLFVAVPVISGNSVNGTVRITYPNAIIAERIRSRMWGLLVAALVSVAVAIIVAIAIASRITRPIRQLQSTTDAIALGDFTQSAEETAPAEVGALGRSVNRMNQRMSALLERQKGFASDASHQLRTPLTALRIRLEQAEELMISDPHVSQSRLQSALAEADRLQQMVDGLLALARSEGSTGKIVYTDLNTLITERITAWKALADESNIELRFLSPTPVVAQAIPNAVEQIVDNFIDNALEYAPNGSTIDISISHHQANIVVMVSDRGPGLTEEQCARALDRFWRAPNAASGGTGLGLTIAAGLAEMSLGKVELHPRSGGGLVASLILTAAKN